MFTPFPREWIGRMGPVEIQLCRFFSNKWGLINQDKWGTAPLQAVLPQYLPTCPTTGGAHLQGSLCSPSAELSAS